MYKLDFVPDAVSRNFWMGVLKVKKHSPEILLAGGIVGGVGAAILAIKAALKGKILRLANPSLIVDNEPVWRLRIR